MRDPLQAMCDAVDLPWCQHDGFPLVVVSSAPGAAASGWAADATALALPFGRNADASADPNADSAAVPAQVPPSPSQRLASNWLAVGATVTVILVSLMFVFLQRQRRANVTDTTTTTTATPAVAAEQRNSPTEASNAEPSGGSTTGARSDTSKSLSTREGEEPTAEVMDTPPSPLPPPPPLVITGRPGPAASVRQTSTGKTYPILLNKLTVFETLLGHGSHGTVVYKGEMPRLLRLYWSVVGTVRLALSLVSLKQRHSRAAICVECSY